MTRYRKAASVFLAICCSAPCFGNYTGLTTLQPGYYANKQGTAEASLVIDRVSDEGFHVVLYSEPSLAKKCQIDGVASYEKKNSKYEAGLTWSGPDGKVCHYTLSLVPAGISILSLKTKEPNCNYVCDKTLFATERTFAFQYPGCSARELAARRDVFKKLYEQKKFTEAYEALNYTYEHCLAYVEPDGQAWLYSDLALAAMKKGDAKKCLEMLDEYEGVHTAPNQKVAKALELNKELCLSVAKSG